MKTIMSLVILAGVSLGAVQKADAQIVVSVAPPAAYIATATPEYYEGRPVYYYNNSWYYRDHYGHWGYYRHEPAYLVERRSHWGAGPGYYHGRNWGGGRYQYNHRR
jgi:hypothetical protein